MSAREDAEQIVTEWLKANDVEHEPGARPGEYAVVLPGERKQRTTTSVLVGDRALSASAFVIRRPEENHADFYRWLLNRNAKLPGIAFSTDTLGDVYLNGRLPLVAVTEETLDELLGAVLTASDESFNELLSIGFISAMRREYAWRIDRGESTRNLRAFMHLLEPSQPLAPSGE